MGVFLDTTGEDSYAIGICDRCKFKFPIGALNPDPNSPGLRVCEDCIDELDPWRLPMRTPEDITIQYPRPEEPLED